LKDKRTAFPHPKNVPSLLAPFSRTTPCRLSAIASGLIIALIWNFPAKNSQILRLFDKIKNGEELQISVYVIRKWQEPK